jgi:hypothetical protein
MHTIYRNDPWPTVSLGGMAKGAALTWNYIQTSSGGAYNWTELDAWVALAQAHNFIDSFFFDIINPPSWTSWAALASDPAPLVAFTTDLVARYKGIIKNYEIANEPLETQGVTPTQLAITVAAVIPVIRAGDPAARILAPTMYARSEQQANWNNYYSIGGSAVEDVDIVTIHGYPSPGDCRPEAIDLNYTGTKPIFALYSSFVPTSLLGKPVWNTEGSWGSEATGQTIPTNQDQQAAFLARYVLLHWSNNIKACCWYAWPSGSAGTTSQVWGRLAGRLAATAWQQVYNWMLGATLTNPIRADGTVWSGSWTRPGGYRAVCVWGRWHDWLRRLLILHSPSWYEFLSRCRWRLACGYAWRYRDNRHEALVVRDE